MKRIVFSGIQPSGKLHIGNYIGAVKRWVEGQDDGLNIFCIVDMHAITVEQDPETLRNSTLDLAALLIASGIDPEKSILFVQSHNLDHANLAWILNCNVSMGQMNRMTQYKEKSEKKDLPAQAGFISLGLFSYPVLMAADILAYDTTHVPVGNDQKQHVELTRDIAERFNSKHGQTFVLPEPVVAKTGARIMSLQDPTKKMSKSDENQKATIGVLDSPEEKRSKIMSAVTDSDNTIKYSPEKPGVSNLLEIYSHLSDKSIKDLENQYEGKNYGELKTDLAEVVVSTLEPIQKKYSEIRNSEELIVVLRKGAEKTREISSKKLVEVYKKLGFVK